MQFQDFKRTVQIINNEEDNSWQGKLNTPTQEAELVVELNSNIMKTIQSIQVDLQSFRSNNMNERNEQQVINKTLLRNMTGGIPQGKPTHSKNRFKKDPYPKWANSPREEGKEGHTHEPPDGEYHSPSTEDSLFPCRKKQISDDNL